MPSIRPSRPDTPPRESRSGIYLAAGVCVAIGLAAGVYGWFRAPRQPVADPDAKERKYEELEQRMGKMTRRLELLQARQLKSETKSSLGGATAAKAKTPNDGPSDASAQEGDPEGDPTLASPPPEETREEALARVAARHEFLDANFRAESRDPSWSAGVEAEISESFRQGALAGMRLQAAVCASTMCKVEVLMEGDSDFETFQTEFTRAVTQSLPNGTMRRIDDPGGGSTVVAYLARRDHTLPTFRPEE